MVQVFTKSFSDHLYLIINLTQCPRKDHKHTYQLIQNPVLFSEEVFNAPEALWFSPSGTYLAVASFNDTNVESAVYPLYGDPADTNNQYPEMVKFKYPKVGNCYSFPQATLAGLCRE